MGLYNYIKSIENYAEIVLRGVSECPVKASNAKMKICGSIVSLDGEIKRMRQEFIAAVENAPVERLKYYHCSLEKLLNQMDVTSADLPEYVDTVRRYINDAIKIMGVEEVVSSVYEREIPHLDTKWSPEQSNRILAGLQEKGFVSKETTGNTFYYRMTGNGVPTTDKVKWIKMGKRRKCDISKSSLVYFLENIANYNVNQTINCRNQVIEVFGISLPTSSITRTSTCEYKEEIDAIVEVK